MTERLAWTIQVRDGVAHVEMQGPVDEDADFAALTSEIASHEHLRFNLASVERINSCGVREWVNFIRAVPAGSTIELVECSPAIVSQINMINNFVGAATIRSVLAPYVCEECGEETMISCDVGTGEQPALADPACPKCSAQMEFDDIEESYFAFLG